MKERTIYALGFFDGVHLGHQALLEGCRELAKREDCRTGVMTFATHPDALVTGNAPKLINTAMERQRLLAYYGMDRVVELPFDKALMEMPWQEFFRLLLEKYSAGGLVCGHDFRFGNKGEGNASLLQQACRQAGIPCRVIPEQKLEGVTVSSTYIRRLLENGDMEQAVRFLGHPHILTGTVVSGRHLGRTIGVPTANIAVSEEVAQPRLGVYACRAVIDGVQYPAVTNVGNRPTVGGHHVTVEPWILDFQGNLYGKEITLLFYAFLRPEKKFPSMEALQEEIRKNAAQTRIFLENC